MLLIQKHDFLIDLEDVLLATYDNLDTIFVLQDSEVENETAFAEDGLLAMFLYDKQKYIDRFCKEQFKSHVFFNIYFTIDKTSLTNLCPYVEHNLTSESDYCKILKFLTLLIVTDKRLAINDEQELLLDEYYNEFYTTISQLYQATEN